MSKRAPGFEGWLKQNKLSVKEAADMLHGYALVGEPGNLVWDYLAMTGDTTYTRASLEKAAAIALGLAEPVAADEHEQDEWEHA